MKLVKLNAINSTNDYLKNLVKNAAVENWTVVTTENQTAGKGQFQSKWHSKQGKNLTFSVLCEFKEFNAEQAFYLSCAVSLGIFRVLQRYIPEKLYIKWPNDILSYSKKICGILIENTLSNGAVVRSIIGVGLNVNQEWFPVDLPKATSMKLVAKKSFNRTILLQQILKELQVQVQCLEAGNMETLKTAYEKHLFKVNRPTMFKDATGKSFAGKIRGITDQGNLLVEHNDGYISSFDLKEIRFF